MSKVKRGSEILQLASRIGMSLFGILVALLFVFGVVVVLTKTRYPRVMGWASLIISLPIMAKTVDRWAKQYSGVLILAWLNAFLTLWIGRMPTSLSDPVPRIFSLKLLVIISASSILSVSFLRRQLTWTDRVALLASVIFLAVAITFSSYQMQLSACAASAVCLLIGWALDRIKRRGHSARSESHVTAH